VSISDPDGRIEPLAENEASAEGPKPSVSNVAKYGAIMTASLALSRILGMLRDTVLAYRFGIGIDADSYRIAAQLPDLIFMLIAGGGLSSAFIPVFSDLIHRKKEREAWKVFSVVVCACSIVAISIIAIVWVFASQIVGFIASGDERLMRDPDYAKSLLGPATIMSRIMLPAQFSFLIGSILLATLYARKHFLAPGLAPNVYNLGIIVAAIFLPPLFGMGIESMAWGALAGAFIGNLLLPGMVMVRIGSHFKPSLDLSAPGVDRFFKLLLPVIVGFSLPSMVSLITQKFSSSYGWPGVHTVLALSNNLMQAPLGIFGQALALAAFPVLAEFVTLGRMDKYRDQISRTLRTVLYLCIPSGALMCALAPLIVHVLYGYGEAANNTRNLAAIVESLQIYSLGIFAWSMQPVLMRGFFSLHKTLKPIAVSTGMTIVFIALCVAATKMSPDYRLLPAATDICAVALAVLLYATLEKDVGRLDRPKIFATMLLSFIASGVAGAVAYGLLQVFHPTGKIAEFADLIFIGLLSAWVYYFITKAMKMPETEYVSRIVDRVGRKARA
jgi:putative peptidoglycan lipid II flippase